MDTNESFDVTALPRLDLSEGPVYVDIGSLEGQRHRAAFAAIFSKVLKDSAGTLRDFKISRIRSKKPLDAQVVNGLIGADVVSHDTISLETLGNALYDNGSREVVLELERAGIRMDLSVRCDNPEFRLESVG